MSTPLASKPCGARTRRGSRCRRAGVIVDGKQHRRCNLHGGLSRGPTTPEGRARSVAAGRAALALLHAEAAERIAERAALAAQRAERAVAAEEARAALFRPQGFAGGWNT